MSVSVSVSICLCFVWMCIRLRCCDAKSWGLLSSDIVFWFGKFVFVALFGSEIVRCGLDLF